MRQICITLMLVMALEKSRRWASTVRLASDWCMFACFYKLYFFLAFISLTTFYIEEFWNITITLYIWKIWYDRLEIRVSLISCWYFRLPTNTFRRIWLQFEIEIRNKSHHSDNALLIILCQQKCVCIFQYFEICTLLDTILN